MDLTIGSPNLQQLALSQLSKDDLAFIIAAVHERAAMEGAPDDQLNRMTSAITLAATTPRAEEEVPDWEPDPPLESDSKYTFGHGSRSFEVNLKILGIDYLLSDFLPPFAELVMGLYRGQGHALLMGSQLDPLGFIIQVFKDILKLPKRSRLKIAFYELFALTFSDSKTKLTSRFVAVLPEDQILGGIDRLVEINRANFTGARDASPLLLRYQVTLLYGSFIELIETLRLKMSLCIERTILANLSQANLSGGAPNIGQDGFGALLTETSEVSSSS